MFFSPIQWLSTLIVKKIVHKLKIDISAINFITNLYHNFINSTRNVGLIPTLRVLRRLKEIINKGLTNTTEIAVELNKTNEKYNRGAVNQIINRCSIDLIDILKKGNPGFAILYDLYFGGFFLSAIFRPIIKKIIKLIFGVIISSMGILFSESLS